MKNKHIFIPLIVFVSVCICCLIISLITTNVSKQNINYSYMTIEFLYDGASDGKDPDGNEFNAQDLLTEDVVNAGIKEAGLESKYSYASLNGYLVLKNVVPSDVIAEITSFPSLVDASATTTITSSNYHPTKFNLILYSDFDKKISKSDLNNLVDSIFKCYCDSFYANYKKAYNTINYSEIYSLDNYDYINQVEVYENRLEALSKFAAELFAQNNTFTYNGKTFNDYTLKANSLINNEVAKIRNSIIYNALSKDVNRLKDYYNYKIDSLNYDLTKYNKDLVNIQAQIDGYEKDSTVYIGTGENVVKVESNSNATYEALLANKITIAEKIASINSELTEYQNILNDIDSGTATTEQYDKVKANIASLDTEYTTLETSLNEMLTSYNDKYIYNGAVTANSVSYYNAKSVISGTFVKTTLSISLPIVSLTIVGICIFYLIREIKKSKKEEVNEEIVSA